MPPTLASVLVDDGLRRRLFPSVDHGIHLAHAGVAPLCGPAAAALVAYAERGIAGGQESPDFLGEVLGLRRAIAGLIGGQASEHALVGPTALGLSQIAEGFPWQSGDDVVCLGHDYPANVYPWLALAARGVNAIRLQPRLPGVVTWDLIAAALTPRTRLVSVASCHYLSGYRPDLAGIGRQLRERGIFFCVDGIQTLGAFPIPLADIDAVAADAHKWLLGPCGAGLLWVRAELQGQLRPLAHGSWNCRAPRFLALDRVDLIAGAQRFEPGTLNMPGAHSLAAACDLLHGLGIDAIAARLLHLREFFRRELTAQGWQPILAELEGYDDASTWRSGILTLRHPTLSPEAAAARLLAANIRVSVRHAHDGQAWLRLSPHAYISDDEALRTVRVLADGSR